jgi:hypothetical protein
VCIFGIESYNTSSFCCTPLLHWPIPGHLFRSEHPVDETMDVTLIGISDDENNDETMNVTIIRNGNNDSNDNEGNNDNNLNLT